MKKIQILEDCLLIKRDENKSTSGILLANDDNLSYYSGEIIFFGSAINDKLTVNVGDRVTYEKHPEILTIEKEEYDLIWRHSIKYVENIEKND